MATAALHRRATRVSQGLSALIIGTGKVIGFLGRQSWRVPGLAGAGLASYGTSLIYLPAGVILGGIFLLLIDNQMPKPGG